MSQSTTVRSNATQTQTLLTDAQVAHFVVLGYHIIELTGMDDVHQAIHRRLKDWTANQGKTSSNLNAGWFAEVLKDPRVAGAMTSLLGFDFAARVTDTWPGVHCHGNPPGKGTVWTHRDSYADLPTAHKLNHLKCFYYPHDVTAQNGPTVVFPETHFRTGSPHVIKHYMNMLGQVPLVVKAGTYVISSGALWHGAAPNIGDAVRYLIKVDCAAQGDRTEPAWNHDPKNMPEVNRILGAELVTTPNWVDWGKLRVVRKKAWNYLAGQDLGG